MNMFKKQPQTLWWGPQVKFLLVGLLITLFMRYVWTFSLANGDEFFFAGLKNTGQIGNYSAADLQAFLHFLWFEHTGRTADFVSTFVYYFGFSSGKWIVSALTGFSISLIAYSLTRAWQVYASKAPYSRIYSSAAILLVLFAVYAPAALNTAYVSNLLVYSAAICNYLIYVALLTYAWSLTLTAERFSTWVAPGLLLFLVGSSHEQAALAVITLVLLTCFLRFRNASKLGLVFFSSLGFFGAALMLFSPGLANKLSRAGAGVTAGDPIWVKALKSLYALAAQYLYLPLFILLLGVAGLLVIYRQNTNTSKRRATGPLAASISFTLVAADTLSVPLASGVGQIRVFHYPMLLGALAAGFSFYLGFEIISPNRLRHSLALVALSLFLVFGALGLKHTYDSQVLNFPSGYAQLQQQIANCPQAECMLTDPTGLPVKHGFSGYGEHEYAHTDFMRQWLAKK